MLLVKPSTRGSNELREEKSRKSPPTPSDVLEDTHHGRSWALAANGHTKFVCVHDHGELKPKETYEGDRLVDRRQY